MILSNQVKCNICNDRPYSAHVHDYRHCTCGRVSVDGGMSYLRRGFTENSDYEDISIEMEDSLVKACRVAIDNSLGKKNSLGILCQVMIALRDNGADIPSSIKKKNVY